MRSIILIMIFYTIVVCILFIHYTPSKKNINISLPEEIQLADKGDMLFIERKTEDTIYIGFYNHNCIDSTHIKCDEECECDGLGCK